MLKFILGLVFLLVFVAPAHALEIKQTETLPFKDDSFFLIEVKSPKEVPPADAVEYEIGHLEKTLPFLRKEAWPIYIVSRRCFNEADQITGTASRTTSSVCIFARESYHLGYVWLLEGGILKTVPAAPYLSAHTAAHEVGHLVRFNCFTDRQLESYIKLRKRPGVNPEELFAEDFRWLFGSDRARVINYQHNIPLPDEKAKKFILQVLKEQKK